MKASELRVGVTVKTVNQFWVRSAGSSKYLTGTIRSIYPSGLTARVVFFPGQGRAWAKVGHWALEPVNLLDALVEQTV